MLAEVFSSGPLGSGRLGNKSKHVLAKSEQPKRYGHVKLAIFGVKL